MREVTQSGAAWEGSADLPQSVIWAWYGLAVIILASVVGSVNRALLGLVAESIKMTLALSDSQLGLLNGLALTLVSTLAAIPVGWLADRIDRRWLLAVCVLIWSAATVGFGFSTSFTAMFIFAMGIAVGEAVLSPIAYSVIPDLFPREKWVVANLVFVTCVLLGSYLGMALGGTLLGFAQTHAAQMPRMLTGLEPWRSTLILSTLSGPVLAVLVLLMRLRRTIPTSRSEESTMGAWQYLMANRRAAAGIFLGFGLSYAAFGAQGQWMAVILQRTFGENPASIGKVMGIAGGIASLLGVGLAWICVRVAKPRYGEGAAMFVALLALVLALVVTLPLPFVTSASQLYMLVLSKITFTFMANSLSPTVLQLMSPPHLRGRVIAIGGSMFLVFSSLMPWLVGFLSDRYFSGPQGILWALAAVVIPGLLGGILFLAWGRPAFPETMARASGTTSHSLVVK